MLPEGWNYLVGLAVAVVLLAVTIVVRNYNEWQNLVRLKPGDAPLPSGSMGWPLFGQTFQFMYMDVHEMLTTKCSKYGRTWKTHFFGSPTICTTTAESAREVLVTKQREFEASYPESMKQILGQRGIMSLRGAEHVRIKKYFTMAMVPEAIRPCVGKVEEMAVRCLKDWDRKPVSVLRECRMYSFNAVFLLLSGQWPSEETETLWEEFGLLEKAIFSLPINLPGTAYRKGLQARQRILRALEKKFQERRLESGVKRDDVLGLMMQSLDGYALSNEELGDNLLSSLFAGQDTTATTLHWAVYHLDQHPEALEDLRAEVDQIKRSKQNDEPLTWDEIKSMTVASSIMQEVVRLNVASYLMRQASTDVVIEGYTVPKGWKVVTWTRGFHTNPNYYENPMEFNPRRYKVPPKPSHHMIWGAGARLCPGSEFARLEIVAFLYHLVTKYTWKVIPDPKRKVKLMPVPHWSDGLQISVVKRE